MRTVEFAAQATLKEDRIFLAATGILFRSFETAYHAIPLYAQVKDYRAAIDRGYLGEPVRLPSGRFGKLIQLLANLPF
jgi:hypothetical protein